MSSSTINNESTQPTPRKLSGSEVRLANIAIVEDVTQRLNALKGIIENAKGKLNGKKSGDAIAGIDFLVGQINNILSSYQDNSKFIE